MPEETVRPTTSDPPNPPFILFWSLWLLWLIFFVPPVFGAVTHPSARNLWLILGAACCTAIYVWTTWDNTCYLRRPLTAAEAPISRTWWVLMSTLVVLGFVMGVVGGQTWLEPYTFAAAVVGGRFKPRRLVWAIGGLEALNGIICLVVLHDFFTFLQGLFLMPVVAIAVSNLAYAVETNRALRLARREIARLAVSEERLRFARDLHDLLGHTLSLIAIKSELAGQLIAEAPADARREVGEIEAAARTALGDVRAAVAGYRQPTLAGEIAGARELLTAAGIRVTVERTPSMLPSAVEALFGWTIREGVTNVLRHSHARHCAITIGYADDGYTVTVLDDGEGIAQLPPTTVGNGLRGLSERAALMGGTVTLAPAVGGGLRLSLQVPQAVTQPSITAEVPA
ncbi:MAG: sensor histidine kinase [Ktedonobacterales bacterium]|nr:sensor histidine kinase [Ktedonobacterales bacterium]